jgi:hypothetical protein
VTFCLDLTEGLQSGYWKSGAFSDVNLTGGDAPRIADGLFRAASLYKQYSAGILNIAGNGQDYTWQNKMQGAALQLAIWEVLYQPYDSTKAHGGYDVTSGGYSGFKVTSGNDAVLTLANSYLWGQYNTADYNLTTTFWNAVTQNGAVRCSQDLIGPTAPVPEPTTILAGALLLLPFGASTIRKMRRNRTA